MIIKGDEAKLANLAITLKKARLEAEALPCYCEEFVTCGKHDIVDKISKIEEHVKDILLTF
jgi:hypothetical protein